jgi:hypothetical protein
MHFATAAGLAAALAAIPATSFGQNPEVQVRGQARALSYYMEPRAVHEVRGSYQMSDGSILDVTDRSSKLYVWLDGRKNELHAIAHNTFASRDRNMTLTYADDERYGNIKVSYIPQASLASANAKRIYLASR